MDDIVHVKANKVLLTFWLKCIIFNNLAIVVIQQFVTFFLEEMNYHELSFFFPFGDSFIW
jgi:hypothetical protein